MGCWVWVAGCGVPGEGGLAYCMVWSVGNRMLRMGCVVPAAWSWARTVRCGVSRVGCVESGEGLQMWVPWCGVWG